MCVRQFLLSAPYLHACNLICLRLCLCLHLCIRWVGFIKDYDGGTLMECYIHPALDYLNVRTFIYFIGLSHTDRIICDSFFSFSSFLLFLFPSLLLLFYSLHFLLFKFRRNVFYHILPSLPACPLHLLFLAVNFYLSLYLSLNIPLSIFICVYMYLSLSDSITLYLSLILTFTLFLSLTLFLYLSLSFCCPSSGFTNSGCSKSFHLYETKGKEPVSILFFISKLQICDILF